MNKTLGNVLKFAGFAAVLIVFLLILGQIFAPSYWFPRNRLQDRTARIGALTLEKENTIDILNLGDSESLQGFVPMHLWKKYGFTSYTCGADSQRLDEARYVLKIAEKTQDLKVILFETNMLFRYNLMDDLETVVAQRVYYLFEGLRYHNLWKQPFELEGVRRYYKGYLINETVAPYEGDPDYMNQTFHWTMLLDVPLKNRIAFRQILDYCESHGIQLILYSMPSTVNYNYTRCEEIQELADKYGVPYLELNAGAEGLEIDWSEDTPDGGDHLNLFGAYKVTDYIGDYLAESGLVTDHRGDPYYAYWDDEAAAFDELVIEMEGKYFGTVEEERDRRIEEEKQREKERKKEEGQ